MNLFFNKSVADIILLEESSVSRHTPRPMISELGLHFGGLYLPSTIAHILESY